MNLSISLLLNGCRLPADLVQVCPSLRSEKEITLQIFVEAFLKDCQLQPEDDRRLILQKVREIFPSKDNETCTIINRFAMGLLNPSKASAPVKPVQIEKKEDEKETIPVELHPLIIKSLGIVMESLTDLPVEIRLEDLLFKIKYMTGKIERKELLQVLTQLLALEYDVVQANLGLIVGFKEEIVKRSTKILQGEATPIFSNASQKKSDLYEKVSEFNLKGTQAFAQTVPFLYVFNVVNSGDNKKSTGKQLFQTYSYLEECFKLWFNFRYSQRELFDLIFKEFPQAENPYRRPLNRDYCKLIGCYVPQDQSKLLKRAPKEPSVVWEVEIRKPLPAVERPKKKRLSGIKNEENDSVEAVAAEAPADDIKRPFKLHPRVLRWEKIPFGQEIPEEGFEEYAGRTPQYMQLMHVFHKMHPLVEIFVEKLAIKDNSKADRVEYKIPGSLVFQGKKYNGFITFGFDTTRGAKECFHKYFTPIDQGRVLKEVVVNTYSIWPQLNGAAPKKPKALTMFGGELTISEELVTITDAARDLIISLNNWLGEVDLL